MKYFTRNVLILMAVLAVFMWGLGDKISYQVRELIAQGVSVGDIADGFWRDLPNVFHVSFAGPDVLVGLVFAAAVVLAFLYRASSPKNYRRREEHGSARWGTPKDIAPMVNPDIKQNLIFTQTEGISIDTHQTQRNLNALIIGSPGSGKTRYFVEPNIAQASTSYVITDPNGEIKANTEAHLRSEGYEIRTLDLVSFSPESDTFNPFAYVTVGQAELDLMILVENLMTNTAGKNPVSSDAFWEKAERAMLSALCAYHYAMEFENATFGMVIDLLASFEAGEVGEDVMSDGDAAFEAVRLQLVEDGYLVADEDGNYTENPNAEGGGDFLTDRMMQILLFAYSQYRIYTQGAGETKKSILISLGVRLAPLHVSPIRRIMASDTIHAELVGQRKTALFLIIPDAHQTFSFLVSMFYDLMFQKNIYIADRQDGRHLPVPVQCFMDEFANIGRLPSFESKIAVMRKRWISACVIIQNYSQGKALYKDDWEAIVGNCDSKLFLGGDEESTVQWVSKRLGKETIDTVNASVQKGSQGSFTQAERSLGRELLTPDELARLDSSKCVYMLRGLPPFLSDKLPPVPW